MDFLTLFVIICMINSALYFIDTIFKFFFLSANQISLQASSKNDYDETCSHYPYIRFLNGTGLNIGFFKITWFTRAFNKTLQRCSSYRPKILEIWFRLGVLATIILLPVSVVVLILSIKNIFKSESANAENVGLVLEPMVPGINLPVSDFGYYLFTITVCSIFHEIGHAIAALKEDVHVSGVGFIAFLMVPIAYVKMNSEQLSALQPKRQLRIFCAGIWNNLALALSAYVFLVLLPFILSPVYDLGRGVIVLNVHQNSLIAGKTGVGIGDKLVAINDCEVSDTENWIQCLKTYNNKPPPGFCVNEDIIHELDQSVPLRMSEGGTVECCDEKSETHLCFETLDNGDPLQIPQYSCLPGRPVIAGTAYMCSTPKDCPPSLQCVRPVTPQGTTLLRIQRSHGNVVIFIGKPNHVLRTVQVSEYVKVFDMFPPEFAESLTRLTKYFVLFSSGLALINTIPCFYFDGNHITYAVVHHLFPQHFPNRNLIGLSVNILGTTVLIIYFSCLIWKSIAKNL